MTASPASPIPGRQLPPLANRGGVRCRRREREDKVRRDATRRPGVAAPWKCGVRRSLESASWLSTDPASFAMILAPSCASAVAQSAAVAGLATRVREAGAVSGQGWRFVRGLAGDVPDGTQHPGQEFRANLVRGKQFVEMLAQGRSVVRADDAGREGRRVVRPSPFSPTLFHAENCRCDRWVQQARKPCPDRTASPRPPVVSCRDRHATGSATPAGRVPCA